MSHWNGRSPVWTRTWLARWRPETKLLWQAAHGNGFSDEWVNMCDFRDCRRLKYLLQMWHWCGVGMGEQEASTGEMAVGPLLLSSNAASMSSGRSRAGPDGLVVVGGYWKYRTRWAIGMTTSNAMREMDLYNTWTMSPAGVTLNNGGGRSLAEFGDEVYTKYRSRCLLTMSHTGGNPAPTTARRVASRRRKARVTGVRCRGVRRRCVHTTDPSVPANDESHLADGRGSCHVTTSERCESTCSLPTGECPVYW